MNTTDLTPSALLNSLEALAAAKNETDSGVLLVTAATMIQDTILGGGSPVAVKEALDQVPSRLGEYLQAVLNRTVDFQLQVDGGSLGLWLVPVVVSVENANLPSALPLDRETIHQLKLGGCFTKQMGMTGAIALSEAGKRVGWNWILPVLYSHAQLTSTDLFDLVNLPNMARDCIRNGRQEVTFNAGPWASTAPGETLYYLPVVVYHPEGSDIPMPAPSSQMTSRLEAWVAETIRNNNKGLASIVTAYPQPHPFSVAMGVGQRFSLDFKLRSMLAKVCAKAGVQANGLAALVAPYAVQNSAGQHVLGVSLVSRLTTATIANLAVPVAGNGVEEAQLAANTLRNAGVESLQLHETPVQSMACQHCGGLQYATLDPALAGRGVLDMAHNIQ